MISIESLVWGAIYLHIQRNAAFTSAMKIDRVFNSCQWYVRCNHDSRPWHIVYYIRYGNIVQLISIEWALEICIYSALVFPSMLLMKWDRTTTKQKKTFEGKPASPSKSIKTPSRRGWKFLVRHFDSVFIFQLFHLYIVVIDQISSSSVILLLRLFLFISMADDYVFGSKLYCTKTIQIQ